MTIDNIIVVSHNDRCSETIWLILAAGANGMTFIDSAETEREAYAIIELINRKATDLNEKQFFKDTKDFLDDGIPKRRH